MSDTRDRLLLWLKHGLGFALEYPFGGVTGTRRWRFDAAKPELMLAVEYDGIGPGHQWPKEQAKDHEKRSEAALCGWRVLVCDAILVNNGKCMTFVEAALAQEVP